MSVKNGAVCFTFDDAAYDQWIEVLPLWAKYNAHATFFAAGEINQLAVDAMKQLQSAGHTVGLHSLHHADAVPFFAGKGGEMYIQQEIMPQLEVCRSAGIAINNFAYPNNVRDQNTDQMLSGLFRHFRAGAKGWHVGDKVTSENMALYDLDALPVVLGGYGIGEYYSTDIEDLENALSVAARANKLIVFFSHGISPDAHGVCMKTCWLERCLAKAASLNMAFYGFDDLP